VPTTLRRTALYDRHIAAGAKIVEFAGWEMPVQYEGVRQEHMAVRTDVGMFDVSHMGEIETSGPQSLQLLQRLISNDLSRVPIGGAQYGVLCREDGHVLDDLFTYRLDADRWLTVTNAANHAQDLQWWRDHADELDARVDDRIDDYAMLAVQGPRAREVVQAISDAPLPPRMTAATRRLAGAEMLVCGTGYTGEDGVELLLVGRTGASRGRPRGAGRARHAAPGGLLPPVRERSVEKARADRGRARLVLRRGHRVCRVRCRARGARRGTARTAGRVRDRRSRNRASGQPDRRRG
jgi:glycine cleavage system aminomethyltransferase T